MDKNKKEILTNEAIKNMVHRIREKDVMLDFDLARIFGYETRRFNENVKRNIEKFEEGSIFQLTVEESKNILKSQIATSSATSSLDKNSQNDVQGNKFVTLNSGRGSNIKYYPYAFTIDGIDVLSTILYGDSIKDNYIKIFNYFNKTNDIVDSENTSISSNILGKFIETVKYEVDNISIDINVSREENTIWLTQADMSILFDTSIPNISMHIQNIMESYSTLKNSVFKKSLTTESVKNVMRLSTDGKTYNVQYYNQDTERLYHSGASIKDAGNRITTITEIKEKDVYRDLFNDVIKKA